MHDSRTAPFVGFHPTPVETVGQLTAVEWTQLISLADRVGAHEGSFGKRSSDRYPEWLPLLREAFHFIYEHSLVLRGFDWSTWWAGEGGRLTSEDGGRAIAGLTLEEVLAMITSITRGEHFSEGTFVEYFDNRTMPRLFERLVALRPTLRESGVALRFRSDEDGVRHVLINPNDANMSGWSVETVTSTGLRSVRPEFSRDTAWNKGRFGGWDLLADGVEEHPWSAIVDHGECIVGWIPPVPETRRA